MIYMYTSVTHKEQCERQRVGYSWSTNMAMYKSKQMLRQESESEQVTLAFGY